MYSSRKFLVFRTIEEKRTHDVRGLSKRFCQNVRWQKTSNTISISPSIIGRFDGNTSESQGEPLFSSYRNTTCFTVKCKNTYLSKSKLVLSNVLSRDEPYELFAPCKIIRWRGGQKIKHEFNRLSPYLDTNDCGRKKCWTVALRRTIARLRLAFRLGTSIRSRIRQTLLISGKQNLSRSSWQLQENRSCVTLVWKFEILRPQAKLTGNGCQRSIVGTPSRRDSRVWDSKGRGCCLGTRKKTAR